ncbi:MAG: CBS domain-containing protein [Actinobacteria bacterium]|nr:CBS domain-containing protein [Actinomycetota bacterium]
MRFLQPPPNHDLTYSDVFLVPALSSVSSRMNVDLTTPDRIGTTIPVVVSNMTAIAGRRMAETVARRGGIVVLPQDIPLDVVETVVSFVKSRHTVYETPITMSGRDTVGEALSLVHKRSHGAIVVVDDDGLPVGIFTEHDAAGFDRFTQISNVMSREVFTLPDGLDAKTMFERLNDARLHFAPVVESDGRLLGCVTRKGALRSTIYSPAVDKQGRLMIAVAVGVNADPATRAKALAAMDVDVVVVDTAHGHQDRMLDVVGEVRRSLADTPVVAGNVVTASGTRDLINAGADIVNVAGTCGQTQGNITRVTHASIGPH